MADTSASDRKSKKDKREKRARVEEAEADETPAVVEETEAAEETEEERAARKAAKAARKAEKKARKAAEEGGEAATAAEEGDAPVDTPVAAAGHKRKRTTSDVDLEDATERSSRPTNIWPAYQQSAEVKALTPAAVAAYREEKGIVVEDAHSRTDWRPITQFSHAGDNFSSTIMECTKGFATPSPIQAQTWPILLSGRDIVGIAATGSGKTLAFTLPAFVHILARRAGASVGKAASGAGVSGGGKGPAMLVLAPTRELAMQTAKVAAEAGATCGIRSCCIYGGVPKDVQRKELSVKGGVQIVIATPGRLQDLVQEGAIDLSNVTYLVLDEADRMLDMGFEKDIRSIIGMLRGAEGGRQTLMFSATWPPAIQAIASEFLTKPVSVTIGGTDLAASHSVTQIVEVVMEPRDRDALLLKLLAKYHASRKNRVLVFVLYKMEAARVEKYLQGRGWTCCTIHGDMSQEARTRSFNAFRSGEIPLLIATDVAARGLDIPSVEYVINYSFPLTIEDYVHRIGRTGRAGKTGIAHTMFTPLDKAHSGELVNVLREAGTDVPPELLKFGTHVKKKEHSLYGAHFSASAASGPPPAATRMKFD